MSEVRSRSGSRARNAGVVAAVAAACFAATSIAAAADAYPSKPIRIIVAFSPGGFVDFTARLIATPLAAALGQQVIVDNRAGAGGVVGSELAARAAPDGYTLTVGSAGTHAVNQSLYPRLPYNVVRDFEAIARLTDAPSILAVHPSLPARSVKELLALARSQPGRVAYASAGAGTSTHLAAALFEHLGHVQLVHVPYKGGAPAMVAVIAGEAPITFGTAASVSPHTRSGRLRGLGVTAAHRSAVLPELPTIAESGLPGYEMMNWLGLFAPAGTPRPVVDRLAAEALRIVRSPEIVARMNAQGAEPSPQGPDEFAAFVKAEVEKWGRVVAATGMTAQ
ncbi:MAG TPA: tripartite tricarboxylate transporter substrate binding protein [Burkholderiales bacterium]|nr:tripartite tricarboxylate transporter substrate binding protein [Burkholderiales bacterium]